MFRDVGANEQAVMYRIQNREGLLKAQKMFEESCLST
jgi:hypothetical protein